MRKIYAFLFCFNTFLILAQPPNILESNITTGILPDWNNQIKAVGDSCGFYYNNYVGIAKTSLLTVEYLQTGNATFTGRYSGRAQRFHAPQPIEVMGVEFYSYFNEPTLDSIMVITSLNQYDAVNDSVGVELIRDTVYVKNTSFSGFVPNMSVKSQFEFPITVTDDYIVSVFTPTNLELYIIANSHTNADGNSENVSYALYNNPTPGFEIYNGWYSVLNDLFFNYDYLIAPLVKFQNHDSFQVLNDTICPNIVSNGCVNYTQLPVFNSHMYNQNASNSTQDILWNWGTGFTNTELSSACHTYLNSGTYNIQLSDNLKRWDYVNTDCPFTVSNEIFVWDEPIPNFSFINSNLTAEFTNLSTNYSHLVWDFGDGSPNSFEENPTHIYSDIDSTYQVWLYASNECFIDSIMFEITTDNVGINNHLKQKEILLYPNPAFNQFTLSNLEIGGTVYLYNIIGVEVFRKSIISTTQNFQISDLPVGTYFVQIKNNNQVITKKLVVK